MSVQQQAYAFMRANDASPVIAGHVIDLQRGGGQYMLEDGTVFRLEVEVCRALPETYPKWRLG